MFPYIDGKQRRKTENLTYEVMREGINAEQIVTKITDQGYASLTWGTTIIITMVRFLMTLSSVKNCWWRIQTTSQRTRILSVKSRVVMWLRCRWKNTMFTLRMQLMRIMSVQKKKSTGKTHHSQHREGGTSRNDGA